MKTILIIEDEIDILLTLKEFLEFEGYTILIAENGLEAMNILETNPLPNLILLDMKMPVMDGWEFAKAFHAKYNPTCPIIVTTAAADAAQRAKDINAVDWESKPFEINKLLEKIKRYST